MIRESASSFPISPRLSRLILFVALLLVLLSAAGCRSMWDSVREKERLFALESARTQTGRGQCADGLTSLDRAQARFDLGPYSRESTVARTRCYEKLGLDELAAAHRRMMTDFYTDEPMAYPKLDGSSVFRVKQVSPGLIARTPSWLKILPPRYTDYAKRSKIIGRVIVSFELARNDRPRKIRVLEMPHPLLATWAIEAIASAEAKRKEGSPDIAPGTQFITTFRFTYRWAGEQVDEKTWAEDS